MSLFGVTFSNVSIQNILICVEIYILIYEFKNFSLLP